MLKSICFIVLIALVAFSCSTTSIPSSSNGERYSEDLSAYRPKHDVDRTTVASKNTEEEVNDISTEVEYDVTKSLNTVLDSIDVLRQDVQYIDGYTVQVYYGRNSSEASLVKGKVRRFLPGSQPILKYDEPNFRVKVGKFYSRIEAQKTYTRLKYNFDNALVIPERIYIK